jgi:hypothetical protein
MLWILGGAFGAVVVVLVVVLTANGNKHTSPKTNSYNLGHAFGLTVRNFPQGQSEASQLCNAQGMNLANYQGTGNFDESAFEHGCLAGAGISGP